MSFDDMFSHFVKIQERFRKISRNDFRDHSDSKELKHCNILGYMRFILGLVVYNVTTCLFVDCCRYSDFLAENHKLLYLA